MCLANATIISLAGLSFRKSRRGKEKQATATRFSWPRRKAKAQLAMCLPCSLIALRGKHPIQTTGRRRRSSIGLLLYWVSTDLWHDWFHWGYRTLLFCLLSSGRDETGHGARVHRDEAEVKGAGLKSAIRKLAYVVSGEILRWLYGLLYLA